jgi:hypothetical protein
MPGCLPWRLSPVGVHHSVSIRPVRCPARPVSSPSGVQPVRCPPSAVRPSGVRCPASGCLVSARLSCRVRLLPHQPGGGVGDDVGAAGNLHGGNGSRFMWFAASRAARSTARGGLGAGDAAKVVGRPGGSGGGVGRSWPVVLGRRRRRCSTADRPGRPDRRDGRAWLASVPGTGGGGSAPFLHLPRWPPSLGWMRDHCPWL